MKLSMMSYTIARQSPPEELDLVRIFELAVELGLEAVDMVSTYGRHPREVRRLLDDFGLKAACHTFSADFNHSEAEARQPALEATRRGLEAAVVLGAPAIMIVTPGKEGLSRDDSRRNFIAGFGEALPYAREAGVHLTVENFPGAGSPFVVAADFLAARRELPDLRLTFDNGNVFTGGEDPAESFRLCAADVVHAHFKDWVLAEAPAGMPGLDGRRYSAALIGEGLLDHRSCLAAMREAGYEGYINIEYEGNAYGAEDATRRAVSYLNGLIADLA